jgi:beta-1,4-mannooligosaccharide/beta-1,4-mannosyl-N-acetylglucosamine phosphorylase
LKWKSLGSSQGLNFYYFCFPCATLADAKTGRIAVYYGAADTYTALAFTTVDELYNFMLEHNKLGEGDSEAVK